MRVGQKVQPADIVAIDRKSVGFRTFNLAKIFNVSTKKAGVLLTKPVGARVFVGNVLARQKNFLGMVKKELISPLDGMFTGYNQKSAVITLEYAPKERKVPAGLTGVVAKVSKNKVVIASQVDVLWARLGLGKKREGAIKIVCNKDIPMTPELIDSACQGKIVTGGSLLELETLYKCLSLGVVGVFVGGIHWRDFLALQGSGYKKEDVGLTVLISEGFGNHPINRITHEYLLAAEGKSAIISGNKKRLIFPRRDLGVELEKRQLAPRLTIPRPGDYCRILTGRMFGNYAKIKTLKTKVDQVEVVIGENQNMVLPAASLEIIRL